MRILFVALLPALFLLASCKKDKGNSSANYFLVGKWKLVRITGGFAPMDMTAEQWGHSVSYAFNNDLTCTKIMDGTITQDKYLLSTGPEFDKQPTYLISFVSGAQTMQYSFAHDTLVLSGYNISDAGADWYVRQ